MCGHASHDGRECNLKAVGGSQYCGNHTCGVGQCRQSKSSDKKFCTIHQGSVDAYGQDLHTGGGSTPGHPLPLPDRRPTAELTGRRNTDWGDGGRRRGSGSGSGSGSRRGMPVPPVPSDRRNDYDAVQTTPAWGSGSSGSSGSAPPLPARGHGNEFAGFDDERVDRGTALGVQVLQTGQKPTVTLSRDAGQPDGCKELLIAP